MIITEKEITPENEKTKNKSGFKLFLIILGTFLGICVFGLFIIGIIVDKGDDKKEIVQEEKPEELEVSKVIKGFENVYFGYPKSESIRRMKHDGWILVDEFNAEEVNASYCVFKKDDYSFKGLEVVDVRLGFDESSKVRPFVCFFLTFRFDEKDSEKFNDVVEKCLSISDFHFVEENYEDDILMNMYENSDGDNAKAFYYKYENESFYRLCVSFAWSGTTR